MVRRGNVPAVPTASVVPRVNYLNGKTSSLAFSHWGQSIVGASQTFGTCRESKRRDVCSGLAGIRLSLLKATQAVITLN